MATLKSVCIYGGTTNDSVEYAIREDGQVFSRYGYFSNQFYAWTKTKWTSVDKGIIDLFDGMPASVQVGFHGEYRRTENKRLRLPQH